MGRALTLLPAGGGTPIQLTDRPGGLRVRKGARGLGMTPYELVTEDTPLADGVVVRDVYGAARTVMLPMLIAADTRDAYLARCRQLEAACDPKRGDAQLELAQHDGRRFRLRVRYQAGLEGQEDIDAGEDTTWWRFALMFLVADPSWYGAVPVTTRYAYSGSSLSWFPMFPLRLGTSEVLGDTTITNPGSNEAFPTWTITAPAADLILTRRDTGEYLSVPGTVPAGTVLTIVTAPGEQAIGLSNGDDLWPQLAAGSSFWTVPPGDTPINLYVGGAATGTAVEVNFLPRHRSPW